MKLRLTATLLFVLILFTDQAAWAAPELAVPDGPMPADAPGLRPGDRAPDFEAVTHEGEEIKLSELLSEGPVVLVFYRGAWCPYCSLHLRQFEAALGAIRSHGARVLALSVDKPRFAKETAASGSLDFPVIGDPDAEILEAYGLVFRVPDDLSRRYREEYGIDLEAHSGRTDGLIAVPAVYVIDAAGIVRFAYADTDYKKRASPEQVVEALERLS